MKIAGDTINGRELAAIFTEAAGRPVAYARFPDELLAANPDLRHMATSLEEGPLADHVDLNVMREINPEIMSFRSWLARSRRNSFTEVIGTVQAASRQGVRII